MERAHFSLRIRGSNYIGGLLGYRITCNYIHIYKTILSSKLLRYEEVGAYVEKECCDIWGTTIQ